MGFFYDLGVLPKDCQEEKGLAVLSIAITYLVVSGAFLGYFPNWKDNRAKGGGICVANHTSPIDVLILSSDNCYAFIGQKHTKFLGIIQQAMSWSGMDHIWFERSEMRDRKNVTQTLKEHVEDASKMPMLIFPEGTCINNTSVMMFKKGSFEIGGRIYPAAIKVLLLCCDTNKKHFQCTV
eukprot:XP_011666201.1 PREDICTED: glycerol-3-phosphate acyltransferase 3-like [Strongylocentrotus purpuratus]